MNAFITTVGRSGPQSMHQLCAARSFALIENFFVLAARNVWSTLRPSLRIYVAKALQELTPRKKMTISANSTREVFENALIATKLKFSKMTC